MSATLKTDKAALVAALTALTRIVERRNTIPILSNVLLSAKAGTLNLTASDLDVQATIPVKCEGEADYTLVAHLLAELVKKLPEGAEILFEANTDKGGVKMVSGRSRFALQSLPSSDFPALTEGSYSHSFDMPGEALARILSRCSFAISNEETRYYLNGIYLHTIENAGTLVLRAVATDGHRLSRCETDAPIGCEGMPGIIVPRKTVAEIIKMASAADVVSVSLSDSKIRIVAGGAKLISKLIDGTFPDYQRVIPTRNDLLFKIDSQGLASAADRVATVSSERGRAVKLSFESGTLTLAVHNPDAGDASEEISVDGDATTEIGFNAKYLAEALANLPGKSITMALADAGSPALIQCPDDPDSLIVLMPMRV